MKNLKNILVAFLLLNFIAVKSQDDSIKFNPVQKHVSKLTIEPGVGIHPMPIVDFRVSNIIQYNANKHLNFVSYSYYARHNAFRKNFNYIKSDYSFSLSQMIGVGTSLYTRKGSHTFSLLGGVKLESFKETLSNPEFDKVSATSSAVTSEFALLYNGKLGQKKYFFSYRVYLPLSPYPARTFDSNAIDGNLANVSLEMGVGIRLK